MKNTPKETSTSDDLSELSKKNAIIKSMGGGAFAGLAAGLAAHYLAGGKMTFPVFLVAYIFILSGVKNKLVATFVFILVASFVSVALGELDKSPTQRAGPFKVVDWVPNGTSLASARQTVEQHGFVCSIRSYGSMGAITTDPDAVEFMFTKSKAVESLREFTERYKTEAVTNISVLRGDWKSKYGRSQCNAAWIIINDKAMGIMGYCDRDLSF